MTSTRKLQKALTALVTALWASCAAAEVPIPFQPGDFVIPVRTMENTVIERDASGELQLTSLFHRQQAA